MRRIFSVLFLLLAATSLKGQAPQPASEQSRIASLETAWDQARQQKDVAALALLLGPDLVFVDYDGTLMNKAEYLAGVHLYPERNVTERMTVYVLGAVAVVNGVSREDGVKNGTRYAVRVRFTDTWIRRGDSWVCIASQSTLTGLTPARTPQH